MPKPNVLILGARAPAALEIARRFHASGRAASVADSVSCRLSGWPNAVDASVGAAGYMFELVSERKGGEQAAATVLVVGPMAGLDLDLGMPSISGTLGSVDVDDLQSVANPNDLGGSFMSLSFALTLAAGWVVRG